jgi:small conductance mechanosensitive channel
MREQLLGISLAYGPKVLVAALMLLAGHFAGGWAERAAARRLEHHEFEPPVRALIASAARILMLGLFIILALQNIGVELLPLIAGLGVAGAAVALAMQGVLGNVAAGLTIIFSKPFRVGDYVSIAGVHGEVLEIRLSSTTLGHADLSRVVVPNRKIVGEILHNYGGIRQLAIEVGVPYEADVEGAIDTAQAVLRANSRVLRDPVPGVGIARLGDSGVTLSITPWVAVTDFGAAGAELNQAILAAFRNRKILRGGAAYVAEATERFAA